jgi:hypothetical protein
MFDLLLRIVLISVAVAGVVCLLGWLVGCAAADRWLSFREWWDTGA